MGVLSGTRLHVFPRLPFRLPTFRHTVQSSCSCRMEYFVLMDTAQLLARWTHRTNLLDSFKSTQLQNKTTYDLLGKHSSRDRARVVLQPAPKDVVSLFTGFEGANLATFCSVPRVSIHIYICRKCLYWRNIYAYMPYRNNLLCDAHQTSCILMVCSGSLQLHSSSSDR